MHLQASPRRRLRTALAAALAASTFTQAAPEVTADWSAKPELEPWMRKAAALATEWHPRLENLLADGSGPAPNKIRLVLKDDPNGVAYASGGTITIMSGWIQKQPDDFGLVVHEVVHVVQNYRGRSEFWVLEGIADYLRWAIYEGKPQHWFPVNRKPDGYRSGYQVAGGFLLWLESNKSPGIVRRLNTALRQRKYQPALFEEWTGSSVDALYAEYLTARAPKPQPQTHEPITPANPQNPAPAASQPR